MSRFFNVKNDNSADGPKIIWDEQINILQPEIAAILDKLRDGQEIRLPLKPVPVKEDTSKKSWTTIFISIFSYIINIFFCFFGFNIGNDNDGEMDVTKRKGSIYDNYSSDMPLLEEHKKELSKIWSTIKSNSIITGRRTLRRLSQNQKGIYTLKKTKINEKEYYILHHPYSFYEESDGFTESETYEHVYGTLINYSSKTQYTGYFYQSKKHGNFTFNYTSEIDAHSNSKKFEIKICKDFGNHVPSRNLAFSSVLQCHYSDIKELIFGFYTDTHITVKLYKCEELIELAKIQQWMNKAKQNFKSNANQIIKFIQENGDKLLLDKNVKITITKNKMEFDIQN